MTAKPHNPESGFVLLMIYAVLGLSKISFHILSISVATHQKIVG